MGVVSDPNHLGMVWTLNPKGFTAPKFFLLVPLRPEIKAFFWFWPDFHIFSMKAAFSCGIKKIRFFSHPKINLKAKFVENCTEFLNKMLSYSVTWIAQQYKMYCFSWFKDGRSQSSLGLAQLSSAQLAPLDWKYFQSCFIYKIMGHPSLLPKYVAGLGPDATASFQEVIDLTLKCSFFPKDTLKIPFLEQRITFWIWMSSEHFT